MIDPNFSGQGVFARDREQAFGDGVLVRAAPETCFGDDGDGLTDERRQAEVGAKTREGVVTLN